VSLTCPFYPRLFFSKKGVERLKSSTGKYFVGLDHVRAIAAFIVFTWHFNNVNNGHLAPPPFPPLSFLTEGHTGVALFMVLSGYLFARLLDGKNIIYSRFILNRFLRLAPLLFVVIGYIGLRKFFSGEDVSHYIHSVLSGAVKPSLPNGGWSITAEFHFYLILPFLLYATYRWKYSLIFILAISIAIKAAIHNELGQIQTLSYWTIIGRIDQFLLGILAFQFKEYIVKKHLLVFCFFLAFSTFYWYFDSLGGFFRNPSYPSPSQLWIYMPAIEGLAYGVFVAWYDNSFEHSTGRISRFVALVGTYSYSIYLLHFFFVFDMASAVNIDIIELSNAYLVTLFSVVCFLLMVPIAHLSYKYIESPFLRFRTKYIADSQVPADLAKL
jgi:rhamnosyltransferase